MGGGVGGENNILIKPFRGVRGHDPLRNFLYLVLLNSLEMHLKLPSALNILINLYSLQMTQIFKAEAVMA